MSDGTENEIGATEESFAATNNASAYVATASEQEDGEHVALAVYSEWLVNNSCMVVWKRLSSSLSYSTIADELGSHNRYDNKA